MLVIMNTHTYKYTSKNDDIEATISFMYFILSSDYTTSRITNNIQCWYIKKYFSINVTLL